MIHAYKRFLQRSLYSLPEDQERPYHKLVNLAIKTTSIILLVSGVLLVHHAAVMYFAEYRPLYVTPFLSDSATISVLDAMGAAQKAALLSDIVFFFALGVACISIFIAVAPVILMRYIAFTLPDRIYMRAFANKEDRERKNKAAPIYKVLFGKLDEDQ
jgi:hypothetical protein